MDIEYRRDMNHNYMIVKGTGPDVPDDYETRVISANRIPGLLTCSMQYINAEIWYSYDVTSLQKLTVFCESRKIGRTEITKVLSEILRILEGLEDYLLDFQHLLLIPSCVCMDFDTMEIRLMYVPFYSRDIRKSLRELAEYLLGCADHNDQSAIVLGYRFCHEVQENNTQLGDLMGVLYGTDRSGAESQPDDIMYSGSGLKATHVGKDRQEIERVGAPSEIYADGFMDSDERGKSGETRVYQDTGSENGKTGKRMRFLLPGRPAAVAVFTGLIILAALYVILHTDFLRHVSVYTLCGIGAAVCAVILFVYIVRERSGNENDMREMSGKTPEDRRARQDERAVTDDVSMLPDAAAGDQAMPERRDTSEQQPRDDLPVTELLSSYRPVRGPEDRWLLPKADGFAKIHLTGNDLLIGKNQQYAEMIVDSPAVSRIHARLRFRAGRYFIEDLSSRNGTAVNGEPVCGEEERVLSEGDEITFADVSYIFSATESGADCESRG